jgi:hypothetical protein
VCEMVLRTVGAKSSEGHLTSGTTIDEPTQSTNRPTKKEVGPTLKKRGSVISQD